MDTEAYILALVPEGGDKFGYGVLGLRDAESISRDNDDILTVGDHINHLIGVDLCNIQPTVVRVTHGHGAGSDGDNLLAAVPAIIITCDYYSL